MPRLTSFKFVHISPTFQAALKKLSLRKTSRTSNHHPSYSCASTEASIALPIWRGRPCGIRGLYVSSTLISHGAGTDSFSDYRLRDTISIDLSCYFPLNYLSSYFVCLPTGCILIFLSQKNSQPLYEGCPPPRIAISTVLRPIRRTQIWRMDIMVPIVFWEAPRQLTSESDLPLFRGSRNYYFTDLGRLPMAPNILWRKEIGLPMDDEYFESIRAVNQLALDYKRVGSFEKALRLQEELVSASILSLGGDHPDTAAFIAELDRLAPPSR